MSDGLVVEHAVTMVPKAGEELCGDSVRIVHRDGATIAVLADGLGSGVKANILSTLTTRIAATLFEKGLHLDAVVETIGSTLPVCRVRNLAYSTFTIVVVESDGRTYLAEFDNPPTLVLRDGELLEVDRRERDVHGRTVAEAALELTEDDLVVVVSDGVVHAGIGGLVPLGWQWDNLASYVSRNSTVETTAVNLAQRVGRTARHLYEDRPGDDTTVLVLRLRHPASLTVVVGPPEDPKDDPRVAAILRDAKGMKVVCGGTTATMIAREWQAPLSVDLDSMGPDMPPLAHIPGVNLTTEGIITVSRALELIKQDKRLKTQKGAPAKLASMLLGADEVHFVVGRAINPAHQNPSLGGRLALKFQVIEELQRELEAQGKRVAMTCF